MGSDMEGVKILWGANLTTCTRKALRNLVCTPNFKESKWRLSVIP